MRALGCDVAPGSLLGSPLTIEQARQAGIVVANGLGPSGGPVQDVLRADGYEHVTHVADGAEVIALLRSHAGVDLHLLDLSLPDMDTLTVVERLSPGW